MFSHLHTHSCYSLLAGIPTPGELAARAAQYGMPALALTDHDRLTGAIEFYDACREAGLQPILGLEIKALLPGEGGDTLAGETYAGEARAGLVLLAQDLDGWSSLCRLSSRLLEEENGLTNTLSLDVLEENTHGLICLTGRGDWLLSAAHQAGQQVALSLLGVLGEVFTGRLYLELQANGNQSARMVTLASMGRRAGLPLVAAGSVYYLEPGQANMQHLLSAIRLNCTLAQLPADAAAPQGSWFRPPEEIAQFFKHFPAALEAIEEIRERCQLELPLGVQHYPQIRLEGGGTPIRTLRRKAEAGAQRLYGKITAEIRERLDLELNVIEDSGYASLFLIMEEIIQFARQADVPYSSRGSAGGSLVAHCLGITSPDPLRLDLYFERFLNPARHTPPDIDTDLCSRRRDQVIQHVYEQYGEERVAMVSTISRFRPRSALREAAKAHGLSQAEISRLAKALPGRGWGPPQRRQGQEDAPFTALEERFSSARYQQILRDAEAILGLPDHLSIHPGGVVIAPGALHDLVPTQTASKGIRITQFDLEMVERLGLVKIDLLGTRGLSVLGDVADGLRVANKINTRLGFIESIPLEDPATADLVHSGRTVGCFGIESPGMQRTLREIEADSVDDIMIALALYRPGPMTGGLKDAFVNRHLGREPVEHLHPALSTLLEETYGVILYQEQVLRIAHELAGFSLSEADLLRRAMSHFDPGERMKTLKEKFVQGAAALNGIPADVGEHIWELMAAFAGYGFPKAHSASYAQVAWRSAYCKTHYPAEFLAAVLANWGGYYGQEIYLLEARRLGLTVRGPHINHSLRQFSAVDLEGRTVLFMGLDQVRELTRTTQKHIIKERPFHTLSDFMARVAPRPKEAEHLVRCGALEGLGTIPGMLRKVRTGSWQAGQMELFAGIQEEDDTPDWSLEQKAAAQQELLGTSLVAHPLELIRSKLDSLDVLPAAEAKQQRG
jgi:DNA polymerase-3 subunit alpha